MLMHTSSVTSTPEEREALAEAISSLLSAHFDEVRLRDVMVTPDGHDRTLWAALAEVGLLGLLVNESLGGMGLRATELEHISEVMGARIVGTPFLGSSVFAATLLKELEQPEKLRQIAAGTMIASVAVAGADGGWTGDHVDVRATGDRLSGRAYYVLDAQVADIFLVVARDGDGFGIFEVSADAPGLVIEPLRTFDPTRRLSNIHFQDCAGIRLGQGWGGVETALTMARIALVGEQAGGGREILARTADYLTNRYQFGRAIGSFQAMKHMAADLLLETESAISAARNAAHLHDIGDDEADVMLALACFACAEVYVRATADAIQMHGGIGFTWEHPAHLFLRRARGTAQLFGTSAAYRERFVQILEQKL